MGEDNFGMVRIIRINDGGNDGKCFAVRVGWWGKVRMIRTALMICIVEINGERTTLQNKVDHEGGIQAQNSALPTLGVAIPTDVFCRFNAP